METRPTVTLRVASTDSRDADEVAPGRNTPLDAASRSTWNKPGVHDPAEPPCSDDRCIAFAEVVAPDSSRQSGGCPPTYCTPGRP